MSEPFAVPVDRPQPSQLYCNGRKLALAMQWFDFDDPAYDPVPVADLAGRVVNAATFEREWVDRCHAVSERSPADGEADDDTD